MTAIALVLLLVGVVVYLLPSLIAANRGKVGEGGVIALNLLLGWTLLGWIVALVWACSGKTYRDLRLEQQRHAELLAALKRVDQAEAPAKPTKVSPELTRLISSGRFGR